MYLLAMFQRKFLILFTLFCVQASAQTMKQWQELGDEAMLNANYASAASHYEEAMKLDSSLFELNKSYAEALRLSRNFIKAEQYYQKVYSKDNGRLFPEGQFWLALMQKQNGKYKDALRNFKKFKSKAKKDKSSYFFKKCEVEIEACTFALNARIDSMEIEVKRLDNPINSKASDFAAFLGPDDKLYFSSARDQSDNKRNFENVWIYSATRKDKSFETPEKAEDYINLKEFLQGNASFSPDGKTAYFSRCTEPGKCQIWYSEIDNGEWSNPLHLDKLSCDCNSSMPMHAIIEGTEVLFFASNRSGGEGGMDIWWSQKDRNGFGIPINAGSEINTPDDEISPFYFGNALYFSSNWHAGFGGFDIFKSQGKPREFKTPDNVGFPFNTQANDIYWTYFPDKKEGYIASNRLGSYVEEGELCCNDIYRFQFKDSLVQQTAYANLDELNRYLPVTLYFHNDEPNPRTLDTTTTLSYEQAYQSYKQKYDDYIRENTKGISGEAKENAVYDVEDFFSLKVDKGMNDLRLFSQLLLDELKNGSEIELAVKGFASPRAKSDYNLNLTRRRIASMENYLRHYEAGVFVPYFEGTSGDGGKLSIVEIPFGEYKADQQVSDELEDEKASIYSRAASLERKIEIQSVQRAKKDSIGAFLKAPIRSYNFGTIRSDQVKQHLFEISNTGTEPWNILAIESECGCTVADPAKTVLLPGESTTIALSYDPKGKMGIQSSSVRIYHTADKEPLILSVSAEVE